MKHKLYFFLPGYLKAQIRLRCIPLLRGFGVSINPLKNPEQCTRAMVQEAG